MRLFYALDPPQALKEEWQAWRRRRDEPLRWSRPEGIHLTLAFVGDVDPTGCSALQRVGGEVASRHRAFPLCTTELDGFPSARKARVLWLGLRSEPLLTHLAMDLRQCLGRCDLPFDTKPFAPHLTLARCHGVDVEAWDAPPARTWQASSLHLMESVGEGRYRTLAEWMLGP